MNGSVLLKNIKRSSFVGMANENIYFDEKGDPPGRFVECFKYEQPTFYSFESNSKQKNLIKICNIECAKKCR